MKKLFLIVIALTGCRMKEWRCPESVISERALWVQECIENTPWTPYKINDCVQASYAVFCKLVDN